MENGRVPEDENSSHDSSTTQKNWEQELIKATEEAKLGDKASKAAALKKAIQALGGKVPEKK